MLPATVKKTLPQTIISYKYYIIVSYSMFCSLHFARQKRATTIIIVRISTKYCPSEKIFVTSYY